MVSLCFAAEKKPVLELSGYTLLRNIRSPQELLYPFLPKRYCVPVTLSGGIAEEIGRTLDTLKVGLPVFAEAFDGKGFHLSLASRDFPAVTHELLSGILNPVELIDIIVDSFVKYREESRFADLISTTTVRVDTVKWAGKPALVVLLLPKNEKFAATFDDQGAYTHESWLTALTITMDAVSHLVYELSTIKCSRTFASGDEKPVTSTINARYRFNYEVQAEALLPKTLIVYFNDVEVLKVDASYRREKKKIVFDKKEICCVTDGKPSCLTVGYGAYTAGGCEKVAAAAAPKNYSKRLEKADALSQKAGEKLRSGDIAGSLSLFRKLIDDYGDTPQAVEARRLLNQLPKGLH